jgi:hypothetical protein
MNTQTNAYVTKFSSGTILALLAFSGLLFIIPVATPIFAANASLPSVSASGNNPALGGVAATFTLSVGNPSSNQFTVTAFTINAPSGWTITGATKGGFLSGTPSYTSSGVTWTVSTFTVGTGAGIPPGSADSLAFTAIAATGTYPFTSTFTSKVQDASAVAFYTGPSFSILVIDPTTSTPVVTPTSATSYIAGSAALTETAKITPAQAGVPIVFSETGYPAGASYSFSPSTALTDSTGTATTVFQPSNHMGDTANIKAAVGTSTITPGVSAGAINTVAGSPTEVTWALTSVASDGNHYIATEHTTLNQGVSTVAINGAYMVTTGASFSIADKFGNPVAFNTAGLTWAITLTALSGGGVFDALGLPTVISCTNTAGADWMSGTTALTPTTACPSGALTSSNLPFNYFQSANYYTIGELSAGVSGSLSGSAFAGAGQSGELVTSTFAAASAVPVVIAPSGVTLPNVPAGDKVNVTATLAPPSTCGTAWTTACPRQAGVPVQLYLDQTNSFETVSGAKDYGLSSKLTAGFSNGLFSTSQTTNANGMASNLFTLDTVAGASAFYQSNVTAPIDTSLTHSLGISLDTPATACTVPIVAHGGPATVCTIGAAPATFTVLTYFEPTLVTTASHSAAGGSIYVDVSITDAYGNPATNQGVNQIQITLTASCSASCPLSAFTVYIPSGGHDTYASFGAITWTMPNTIGSVTLTATGVLKGKQITSAPAAIGVVSPLPTLAIISPKNVGTIYSSKNSVVFTGQANVSIGYAATGPLAVKIVSVTYKIDSGSVQTAPITSGYSITFSVAATMTPGLHHLSFNATDSVGNVAVGTTYSVLIDVVAPTVAFTTATGAKLNYSNTVVATITVPEGDLNLTSVTPTLNGTALSSSHFKVTGTNNLGSSVSYTVTISGLPAGSDNLGLSASSLAGLTGTAKAITVTVSVPPSQSVIIVSASYGTEGGYTGISITATNIWSTSQNLIAFAVWKNSAGQTVAVTTGGLGTMASGATTTTFAPLLSALPSGSYTVNVFVVTTGNLPVSSTTSITASV